MDALQRALVERLKCRPRTTDIPRVVLEAAVAMVIEELPNVFGTDETEDTDEQVDWRKLTLDAICDPESEWVGCENGTLWPEDLCVNVGGPEDGTIWMPKHIVEDDEGNPNIDPGSAA